MPMYVFTMRYQLEGEEERTVQADQRDVAEWEAQPFGHPMAPDAPQSVTFWRFITWAALKRTGEKPAAWDGWRRKCVYADMAPPADDAEDPGRPGPSDTPS